MLTPPGRLGSLGIRLSTIRPMAHRGQTARHNIAANFVKVLEAIADSC